MPKCGPSYESTALNHTSPMSLTVTTTTVATTTANNNNDDDDNNKTLFPRAVQLVSLHGTLLSIVCSGNTSVAETPQCSVLWKYVKNPATVIASDKFNSGPLRIHCCNSYMRSDIWQWTTLYVPHLAIILLTVNTLSDQLLTRWSSMAIHHH